MKKLTEFGIATMKDRYLLAGEEPHDMFRRVANAFADDLAHAERLFKYMSELWFMPASPVLMNGGSDRGLPISCYLNSVEDSREGIFNTWAECGWLGSEGGGIGTNWSNIRSIGETVHGKGTSSGIIPFIKVQDAMTLSINQGSLRRGAAAVYLSVSHPEIQEFLQIRKPAGDKNRKALNLHQGVCLSDSFMKAVKFNLDWDLVDPHTSEVKKTISARSLFASILEMRIQTGEPYLFFEDNAQAGFAWYQKKLGMKVSQSNLCSEIMLHTGIDHRGENRTAVCCLSSLNLEYYEEWKDNELFIEDIIRFLDNVLQSFIDKTENKIGFEKARYSAISERSIGLGVMGLHSFFQKQMIPFDSFIAKSWNKHMFNTIRKKANAANQKLAEEKGSCPDAVDAGAVARCSHILAIAPTASISILAGGCSPCIEPFNANIFTQKTLTGYFVVKNKYLEKLLQKKGSEEDVKLWWDLILEDGGSVQSLDCLTQEEKDVFKTSFEIDQRAIIDMAADRTPFIDQGQSINLFLPSDVHKSDLLQIHMKAWERGVKSLYYLRSKSIKRAGIVNKVKNYEECLACQ